VRRIVMFLAVATIMLVMAAGVAVAVNKQCGNNLPCRGTDNNDQLHERIGNHKKDRIHALKGNDLLDANNYRRDRDRLEGGPGRDRLLTNDNDSRDSAFGGRGNDKCIVDRGDNAGSCSVGIQAAGVDPAGFTD
jgi:hypothetical protein